MDHPPGVGRRHCIHQRYGDSQQLLELEAGGRNPLAQSLPLHQLEGQKRDAVRLLDGMEGDDVGMIEGGDGTRFALETVEPGGVGEGFGEHLEGDLALEPGVEGEVDLPHSAGAEKAEHAIVGEGGADHELRRS